MERQQIHSRIAPTPSGFLHRGNAYNFLLTALLVQKKGGSSLRLRIDDLDAPRVREAYVQDIFTTLRWLDIHWNLGPENPDEQHRIYSQQLRIPRYQELLDALAKTGHVFACTCSRKDIAQNSKDGQYPGTCRLKQLPLDTPDAAWRLHTPQNTIIHFSDALLGNVSIDLGSESRDFIVRRRDGVPAYHIASLADDVDHGINGIVRGADLLTSTAAQLYLSDLVGATSFRQTVFYHHPILQDTAGDKLSKSAGSSSIRSIQEQGVSLEQLYQEFRQWLEISGIAV